MKGLISRLASLVFILAFTLSFQSLQAQCISGNCRNGTGSFRFNNGDEYAGLWKNGQPNGKGIYRFTTKERYEGDFVAGKFDGRGTMFYPDGAKFAGGWKDNRKHGNGIFTDKQGKATRGTWSVGKIISEGQYADAGSTSSNGTSKPTTTTPAKPTNTTKPPVSTPATNGKPKTKNDIAGVSNCNAVFCRSGKGYFDYPDGSRWIGTMKDGYPGGNGTCFYSNGDRYEGQWAANAPNGPGIMYFSTGRVYGAQWVNGAPMQELDSDEVIPSDPVKIQASQSVKIWAVVVGVGKYTAMPSLKFPDDDAYRFYSFLKSPEGGALGDDQIEVLVDEGATRERILKAMRETFLKADKNDVIIFYYSGHGLEGCFLPVDFDGYNNKLRHDEIKQIFKESKAKHKLCIADACHSGSLNLGEGLAAKGPAPVSLARYYQAFEDADGGIALLMSSQSEELSLEDHGLRQGVFTYYILQGLKGKADNNNDFIVTIKELYTYVHARVREYTSGVQSPVLTGTYDDTMPVALRRN